MRHCRVCLQPEDECWCGEDEMTEAVAQAWRADGSDGDEAE